MPATSEQHVGRRPLRGLAVEHQRTHRRRKEQPRIICGTHEVRRHFDETRRIIEVGAHGGRKIVEAELKAGRQDAEKLRNEVERARVETPAESNAHERSTRGDEHA